ncbi:hypothetical protein CANINC_000494 [Pichia inconspicua]|uniref:Uncharacterized protein n=1 Tax=Pichia inconspicua TaxID=52247 RepID=A0A4T0X7D4_9ASCO|nr:hypothetical protein CANINC_000494 [[Candida] inconspicua]
MNPPIDDLVTIFKQFDNDSHTLILDPKLKNSLNYLTNNNFSKFAKSCNIDQTIWFNNSGDYIIQNNSIVFLLDLSSNLDKLNTLQLQLKKLITNHTDLVIHLILSHPLLKNSIDTYIKQSDIFNLVRSYHIWNSLLYLKLPDNVYSLEYNENAGFKDIYLNNSPIPLESQANVLLKLYIESNYKLRITNIFLKGSKSIQFYKIFQKLRENHLNSLNPNQLKTIQDIDDTLFINNHSFYNNSVHLISIDRSNDLISLLLNQLTYAGLSNEFFNLNQFEPLILQDKLIDFNTEDDQILNTIKHLNFSHVGPILNKNAKDLQIQFEKRKQLDDISKIKKFVSKIEDLKQIQSKIANHTLIAEKIINNFEVANFKSGIDILDDELEIPQLNSYYTQLIEFQQDILADNLSLTTLFTRLNSLILHEESKIHDLFKLIILASIIKKGLRESDLIPLISRMVNKFTSNLVLPIYINLLKLKIIQLHNPTLNQQINFLNFQKNHLEESNSQSILDFADLSKILNLLPQHDQLQTIDSDNPLDLYKDPDFGYPGYVPITTRLIESIYSRTFIDDKSSDYSSPTSTFSLIYGWKNLPLSLTTETIEEILVPESKKKLFTSFIPPKISKLNNENSKIIISIIGGITLAEIATIKFVLSKIESTKNKQIIFLTTGILNSETFIKSLQTAA